MKFSHNQIVTKDGKIEVGKQYCYKEDWMIVEVKIISNDSNKEFVGFTLEVVEVIADSCFEVGEQFNITAIRGHYAYNGMWRLWDSGEYVLIRQKK